MSLISYIALVFLLFLASFLSSLIGLGGGSIFTPIQVLFDIKIHGSAANSLFLILIGSSSAAFVYLRSGKIDWRLGFPLAIFSVIGGFFGGGLSDFIPENIVLVTLIIVVIFSGILMFVGAGKDATRERISILALLPFALFSGFLSGVLGIGGGIVLIPILCILLKFPVDISIASTSFAIFLTSASGFLGHFLAGHWDWRQGLIMAPATLVGAMLGAHIMLKTSGRLIKGIFGTVMFLIALSLIVKNLL